MLYKSKVEDFCPTCGSKVFAKDDIKEEESLNTANIELYCSTCDATLKDRDVFGLRTEYNQLNGQVKMKYLIFPFGYCDSKVMELMDKKGVENG